MDDLLNELPAGSLKKTVQQKDIPKCSICLVLLIVLAHTLVLVGNLQMAQSFATIGISTGGWSDIGLSLSRSLQGELDEALTNITAMLTDAIEQTMSTQSSLDSVLGLAGQVSEAENSSKAMALLQTHGVISSTQVPDAHSVSTMLDALMDKLLAGLHRLMVKLEPALLKVGEFITKFGKKIQTMLEHFSVTLDRVQKVFDQVMQNMAAKGENAEDMLHEAFSIFDATNSGEVTATDMKNTGLIYAVPALQGNTSDELAAKYDRDRSGGLSKEEFLLFTMDPAIPSSMSVVLRSFAKSLAGIAGQVGGSRFRGEIASDVADYLELMAQKNMTKVSWISDALTNGTLPIEFAADIIVNLALKVDDPNALPVVVAGEVVVEEMMRLHPQQASQVIDQLSNSTFWLSEGFSPSDQAAVVQRVTTWATKPQLANLEQEEEATATLDDKEALEMLQQHKLDETTTMIMERRLLKAIPDVAYKLVKQRMRAHLADIEKGRRQKYDALFSTQTSQHLCLHLLGGETASNAANSAASQMVKTGIPARPETLVFAKWLSWNASDTADRFQRMSFEYQKTSSNAIDGFATKIQGMVKKVQGFIAMMEQYSTPDGVAALNETIEGMAANAADDLMKALNGKLLEVGTAANQSQKETTVLQQQLEDVRAEEAREKETSAELSGAWEEIVTTLKSLTNVVPQANKALLLAKKEVMQLAKNLDSIFKTFLNSGPPVFDKVGVLWREVFVFYYCMIMLFPLALLFYAFWAGGYFAGPGLPDEKLGSSSPESQTLGAKCSIIYRTCCYPCMSCHRSPVRANLCFWSVCILMQIVVLTMFLISLVFCVLTAVKLLLSAGCGQIYVLGDASICGGALANLRTLLGTFLPGVTQVDLQSHCIDNKLLACDLLAKKMQMSSICTVTGSFMAAVFSFQLIIESATLHERAVSRYKIQQAILDKR